MYRVERKNFAQVIKNVRKNKGFTQIQIANTLGVTQPYINNIETGRRLPTVSFMKLFYILLDADIARVRRKES
ncbi:MAG: helix-turn-helix domain-containing protein [Eubacteriales bacterium]